SIDILVPRPDIPCIRKNGSFKDASERKTVLYRNPEADISDLRSSTIGIQVILVRSGTECTCAPSPVVVGPSSKKAVIIRKGGFGVPIRHPSAYHQTHVKAAFLSNRLSVNNLVIKTYKLRVSQTKDRCLSVAQGIRRVSEKREKITRRIERCFEINIG